MSPLLKKILNTCVVISIIFITLEVSARLDDNIKYDAPLLEKYSAERLKTKDIEGIGHNISNSRFEKWEINKYGFRGPEISLQKPPHTVRIICMGSSETFGLFENPEKEWPAQLREKLNKIGSYEVINTAVVGLSLKNYQAYLEKYVLKFDPDIVILYINPFFCAASIETQPQEQLSKDGNKKNKRQNGLFKEIISNLRILPKIKQAIKKITPPKILRSYQFRKSLKIVQSTEKVYLKGKKAKDLISNDDLTIIQTNLIELIRFLSNKKIDVILSSYPTLYSQRNIERYSEILLDNRRFCIYYSFAGLIDILTKVNKMVKETAREYQCGFIDNYRFVGDDIKYFGDAIHYTDAGAELVAQNFANYIDTHYKPRYSKISRYHVQR